MKPRATLACLAGLLALVLSAPRCRAGDDDSSGGFFGSLLKSRALKGVAEKAKEKVPLDDQQWAGVARTAKALRKSAQDIDERQEHFIGRAVAAQILARYPPVDDERLGRYVQSVLETVAGASSRPEISTGYHAQVVRSDEVNAVSAPGGYVFVTTALLRSLKDEDELACVLAHEVAHIADKHGLKTIKAARLTSAFEVLGSEAARNYSSKDLGRLTELFGGSVDDVVNALVVSGYSRDKELEADRDGVRFARAALYDPGALERVIARVGGKGGFLRTHPSPERRLAALDMRPLDPASDYQETAARRRRFAAAMAGL